jgi:HD superfamily phosphohydrolase
LKLPVLAAANLHGGTSGDAGWAYRADVPMRTGAKNRAIRDAIHGLISVDPCFWKVIDAPEVQRLRWIRQTGLAYLVYPGSEHSRFAHVIGVYGLAQRVFNQLLQQATYTGILNPSDLDEDLRLAFTTAALCHDLGHTAFSHVLEQILLPAGFRTHEDCTLELLQEGEVGKRIRNIGCDLEQVVQLLKGEHWFNGLCKLISGHVDVDRLDYLMRDAASAGVGYGNYDLDWMINSLSLHLDKDRRPRLLLEVQRGVVAVEQFSSARRSMYQQVYYHATVRGAGRLLRAVFERASDPARPEKYKNDARKGIPNCLHSFLRGDHPTLGEFLNADDTTIVTALKQWGGFAKDPVLRYLAKCFLERRLYKEIQVGALDWEASYGVVRDETRAALGRQKSAHLPSIGAEDTHGLDYFVLADNCEFKADTSFEGVLFDVGDPVPMTFEDVEQKAGFEIVKSRRNFSKKRLFVASEVASSVQEALREMEAQ